MRHSEAVEVRGHIFDTGLLARILEDVVEYGGDYRIERLDIGREHAEESRALLTVAADDADLLDRIVMRLQTHGVNPVETGEVALQPAPADGVFPENFYSTTNLDTQVRLDGVWLPVGSPEMDCGIVVDPGGRQARTVPVSDVRSGDLIVCGSSGVRVRALPTEALVDRSSFAFMSSTVSSEKPQAVLVQQVAEQMRAVRASGEKILWVCGPAVVHTGAASALVRLVEQGYVDVLFAGNALAAHDIEAALYGTSLGVDLAHGHGVPHGHEHHIRAINRIRMCGSIHAAVEQGVLRSGIMHALVTHDRPFVLVGSVRDDGPMPDVYADVIAGQRAMRAAVEGVGYAIMLATMLHSIATGNLLPARVPLVSVDINPATVTKLTDRGSTQATGIVTDVGLFLEQLAARLAV